MAERHLALSAFGFETRARFEARPVPLRFAFGTFQADLVNIKKSL